jgi:hypothetical protein
VKPWRITIHCSDTKDGEVCDISEIRSWHRARGWIDVGYHGVIQPDGEWQKGRGLNVRGAGVSGENEGNLHICLIGRSKFSKRQFDTLRYHLEAIFMLYDIEDWNIFTHHQFNPSKTCPNIPINNLLCWYYHSDNSAIQDFLL